MKKVELLAPAGNFDCLKVGVNYGADAIYLGGTTFSARAFANNFNHEELIEAVNYCHLRNVKVYVTLNTLLNENEIENALKEARFYYENKVDALIVQDLGLFYKLKQELPDFPLHASTQMHIHNLSGVKNAKELGFSKVVLARESNLNLIKAACKEGIEIECFVHGAICTAYSGQCLISSVSKNRSANKGMCAQCCRLKYQLFDETSNRKISTNTEYLLSPKDMYLLNDIPKLIEAGVSSFKIEGRLKSPAYVGLVTSLYRKAIDAYYNHQSFTISKEEHDDLLAVFNRGFTNAYLLDSDSDIYNNIRPNHMGKEVGKVIACNDGHCVVRLFKPVNQFDGIRILNKQEDVGKILNTISINKKFVSSATKDDVIEFNIDGNVAKGDIVIKTLDFELEKKLNNYHIKRLPLNIELLIKENLPIKISCQVDEINFKKEYPLIPQVAKNAPLSKENIIEQFSKFGEEPFFIEKIDIDLGNVFLAKSQINEIRREFINDLESFILASFKRKELPKLESPPLSYLDNDDHLFENHLNDYHFKNEFNLYDPVINQDSIYQYPGICSEFGGLIGQDQRIAYYTLNCSNSYAYEFLNRLGFSKIILSTELKSVDVTNLIVAFKQRNKKDIKPYVLIYGKRPLMYFKRNPIKEYWQANHQYRLNADNHNYLFKEQANHYELCEYKPLINNDLLNLDVGKFYIIDSKDDLKVIDKYLLEEQ